MHIPVDITVGCMVFVVLPLRKSKSHINTVEKWCEVTNVYADFIIVKDVKFKVPLFAIEFFTFGGIAMPNPDFDLQRVLKI